MRTLHYSYLSPQVSLLGVDGTNEALHTIVIAIPQILAKMNSFVFFLKDVPRVLQPATQVPADASAVCPKGGSYS